METAKETGKKAYVPAYVSTAEFQKFASMGQTLKQLTAAKLTGAGFSTSNSYILFSSLKALKIYDQDGNLLERDDVVDLGSKDQDIKRQAYERIVKRAYSDVLEKYSPETVTLETVRNYFQRKGAAHSVSIKAARLFLWLLEQAGLRKPEEDTTTEKIAVKKPRNTLSQENTQRSSNSTSNRAAYVSNKQRLLDAILETISTYNGLPPVELVREARELIAEIDLENNPSNPSNTEKPELADKKEIA